MKWVTWVMGQFTDGSDGSQCMTMIVSSDLHRCQASVLQKNAAIHRSISTPHTQHSASISAAVSLTVRRNKVYATCSVLDAEFAFSSQQIASPRWGRPVCRLGRCGQSAPLWQTHASRLLGFSLATNWHRLSNCRPGYTAATSLITGLSTCHWAISGRRALALVVNNIQLYFTITTW